MDEILQEFLNSHHGEVVLKTRVFNWYAIITWWERCDERYSSIGCRQFQADAYGDNAADALRKATQKWAQVGTQDVMDHLVTHAVAAHNHQLGIFGKE